MRARRSANKVMPPASTSAWIAQGQAPITAPGAQNTSSAIMTAGANTPAAPAQSAPCWPGVRARIAAARLTTAPSATSAVASQGRPSSATSSPRDQKPSANGPPPSPASTTTARNPAAGQAARSASPGAARVHSAVPAASPASNTSPSQASPGNAGGISCAIRTEDAAMAAAASSTGIDGTARVSAASARQGPGWLGISSARGTAIASKGSAASSVIAPASPPPAARNVIAPP
jgi:hypothetical protein